MVSIPLTAQVKVDFTQRTSTYSSGKKIYNIKGDFQMIGNTNLTLQSYGDNTANSNNNMIYVDVDGNPQTLNSSTAELTFSTENGAEPACSHIIYAGLYWTGRAHNSSPSSNTFTVTKNVPGAGTPQVVNNNQTPGNGASIIYTNYTLNISRSGTNNNRTITYTFTPASGNSGNTVAFTYAYNSGLPTLNVSVNGGSAGSVSTSSINASDAYLSSPYTIYDGGANGVKLTVNHFYRNGSNSNVTDANAYTNVTGTYTPPTGTVTKNYDKSIVYIKHQNATVYEAITAADVNFTQNIYYPTTTNDYMYSAYAEVTDYVKAHGLGSYTVADMALNEGNGGSTGYYGGWAMIVVYENSKMKWRDVTIFDGHAYIYDEKNSNEMTYYELPVSGFHTAQDGDVNMKVGIIAGEGDRGIGGGSPNGGEIDNFSIRNYQDNAWVALSTTTNPVDNFFASSIVTTGVRNPSLYNNTGLDIVNVNVPVGTLTHNQTSTKFRYGTNQDTYIISCIAMAVDAYIPEPEALCACTSLNGQPNQPNMQILPDGTAEYSLEIRNKGTEAINDAKITIPIPYTATFVSCSSEGTTFPQPVYNATLGANGSIVWNMGTIPYTGNPTELLGKMRFALKATTDCFILSNSNCTPEVTIQGGVSGVGATSQTNFSNYPFVRGFEDGICQGEPITSPLSIVINSNDYVATHCANTGIDYTTRKFELCKLPSVGTIPFNDIIANFPAGSRFWSEIDATGHPTPTAIEYTISNSFPNTVGVTTYYCIPPGSTNCYWAFTIEVKRCNFWLGSTNSSNCSNWNIISNWTDNRVPNPGEDIVFASVTNNGQAALSNLILDNDRVVGNVTNESSATLIIPPSKTLTVNGLVKTDAPERILIKSTVNEANGAIIFNDLTKNTAIPATVEFASKSKPASGTWPRVWQYFGTPVSGRTLQQLFGSNVHGSIYGYNPAVNIIVRKYNEALNLSYSNQEKWEDVGLNDFISPYNGYEITQPAYGDTYSFKGALVTEPSRIVNLPISPTGTYARGNYILANPYAAPIFIPNLLESDFTNLEKTVYLFNAGSRQDWLNNGPESGSSITYTTPGTYLGIPINASATLGVYQIPSMQGFLLVSDDEVNPSSFKFRYETVYRPASSTVSNEMMRAKGEKSSVVKNSASNKKYPLITVNVKGNNSQDRLYMATATGTTKGFDNGWDGYKYMVSKSAQVYVMDNTDSKYQVSTDDNLNDTYIGFRSGGEDSYELSFKFYNTEDTYQKIFIQDLVTKVTKEVTDGMKMNFLTVEGSNEKRFKIIAVKKSHPEAEKAADQKLFIKVMNTTVVIDNNTGREGTLTVYNLVGQPIMTQVIPKDASTLTHNLKKGSYIFEAKNDIGKYTVKAIIQ